MHKFLEESGDRRQETEEKRWMMEIENRRHYAKRYRQSIWDSLP